MLYSKKFAMRKITLSAAALLVILLLTGCSIHEKILQDKQTVAEVHERVTEITATEPRYKRVSVLDSFYVPPLSKADAVMPDWFFTPVYDSSVDLPFQLVVNNLIAGQPVTPKFYELSEEDKNQFMRISFSGTRLGDALEVLAKTAGYALSIEGNSVVFSKFAERTFTIAGLPGDFNSQIGNDAEMATSTTGANTNQTGSASIDAGNRQFSSLKIQNASLIEDLRKALEALKSEQGVVSISPLTMTVFVKDRPSVVSSMERTIEEFNAELTKGISLDIVLLDVIYTTNNRQGFDVSLASKLLDGQALLKSNSQTPPFIAGSGTTPSPSQFNLELLGSDFNGTKLFIDALKKQADISRVYQSPIELSNGTQSKVMSVDSTMFIAEQYGANATTGGVLTGGGSRQENLQTGQIFNVFAKAIGDDVLFKLNVSVSAKLDIKIKESKDSGLYLESPETTAMIFDQTMVIENGVTRVVTGLNASTVNISDSNAGYDALGFSRTSETVRKETILLVTPKITRGLSAKKL